MNAQVIRLICRNRLNSTIRVNRRFLFDWIPDKIKYAILPDRRTEKEKFLAQEKKDKKKQIDEIADKVIEAPGVMGYLFKTVLKRTAHQAIEEMTQLNADAQEATNLAESIIINNARVKKVFGDDVQLSGILQCRVEEIAQSDNSTVHITASIDGSRKSGYARLVVQREDDEMKIRSITLNDGQNEFDISDLTRPNVSSSSSSPDKSRIIDVKARDD